MAGKEGLSPASISKYRTNFYSEEKNVLAQNIVTKVDPVDVCTSRKSIEELHHVFTHKIETEGKPVTNQKNSGRCWIFACLNVIRIPFMKSLNLEEFEFSQAHLFFWDKVERSYYFLQKVIDLFRRGEQVEGRLMSFMLSEIVSDGGQWDMLVNLINKYGLMPKRLFPEAYSDEKSNYMNSILRSKLRENAKFLWDLVAAGADNAKLNESIERMREEIFRIVGICLGIPSETFNWEYYDKSKQYHCTGLITSKDFYDQYVRPVFNVDDKVCLVNDPRPSNSFGSLYTVDCLGNMVGGKLTLYNNQPIELLMKVASESIKNNEAIWFGCDVRKKFHNAKGFQDLNCLNFKLVFGVDVFMGLNKAERLIYGDSKMTHAMVLTAVSVDGKDRPLKWRVENSWGDDKGDKGYLMMTSEWFQEFVYEVVVDKKYVPLDVLSVLEKEPIVLPAWDPMGALAF